MSANTLFDGAISGGATLVSDGPIVGTDEPALTIPAADYLTTGDLTVGAGDAGDVGGGGLTLGVSFAIEFWFRTPTTGTQQILAQGPNAHAAVPNRQWTIYLAAGGQIKFDYVDTSNANHSLTGATVLQTGQWYHVVATKDTTQRIYINGVQDGSQVATLAQWGDLIAGSADMRIGATTTTYALDFAEFAFYRDGMVAARALAHYQAGAQRGFGQESTSRRVRDVLDQSSSLAPRSFVDTDSMPDVAPRYMTGQSILDPIREAAACDIESTGADPMFFTTADGTLLYLQGVHRAHAPYSTIQATFGDQSGELPYSDVAFDYSDSYLINDVAVTREGTARVAGQTRTSSDPTSIASYGLRHMDFTPPLTGDVASQLMADGIINKFSTPIQRILSIELSTLDSQVAWTAFQREIADKIRILRTPPGGGARIQQDVWIQKIEISGTNDGSPLAISWAVSPL